MAVLRLFLQAGTRYPIRRLGTGQAIRNRLANKETVRLDGGVATQKYGKARRIRPRVADSVNQRQGFIDASLRAGALGQCAVNFSATTGLRRITSV